MYPPPIPITARDARIVFLTPPPSFFSKGSWPEWIALAAVVACSSWLFFGNLGNHCLWQDEAQTALISKTILTDGLPKGRDEKNSFSQELGREIGAYGLYRWHTWLPFYATAASFAAFGVDTFQARLPFAAFGLATVVLSYFSGRQIWASRRAAFFSAASLATCVPFLILARQCRYYSPSAFFALLGLFAYYNMLEGKRWAKWLFVASGVLLFQSHFPYWGALLLAVFFHALTFHREQLKVVAFCSLGTLLCNLPWIVWFLLPPAVGSYSASEFSATRPFFLVWAYFALITKHAFPLTLWRLLVVAFGVDWIRRRKVPVPDFALAHGSALLMLFTIFCVASQAALTPNFFFRYLPPIVPVLCLFAGRLFEQGMRLHTTIGIGAFATMLYLSPMSNFVYELTHDYDSPMKGVASNFNEHAQPDDVAAITYGDMTLKFYTNLRIVGGLTGEDLSPAYQARWVIFRHMYVCEKDLAVTKQLQSMLPAADFAEIELESPDIPFDNREEPDEHFYRTVTKAPRMVIYERIRN